MPCEPAGWRGEEDLESWNGPLSNKDGGKARLAAYKVPRLARVLSSKLASSGQRTHAADCSADGSRCFPFVSCRVVSRLP